MSFHICFPNDDEEENPPLSRLKDLLQALKTDADEESDVAVIHESGWTLEADSSGFLHWINIDDVPDEEDETDADESEIIHWGMVNVPEEKILELFTLLANGEIEQIKREPWIQIEGEDEDDEEE